MKLPLEFEEEDEVEQATENPDVGSFDAYCPNENCNWRGKLRECGSYVESESWENPCYLVPICPVCGESVEF
jgi:hypothetical protein